MANIGGITQYNAANARPYRPKKKKDDDGIIKNFFDDLWGMRYAPLEVGKQLLGGWGDAAHAVGWNTADDWVKGITNTKGSWNSDDILKNIVNDYKYTYGPATHGDFRTTWGRITAHPLGPVLDVVALASGGAGAAAKGASLASQSTKAVSLLGRANIERGLSMAGLERVPYLEGGPRRFDRKTGSWVVDESKYLEHPDILTPELKRVREATGQTPVPVSDWQAATTRGSMFKRGVIAHALPDEQYPSLPTMYRPKTKRREYTKADGSTTGYDVESYNNPLKRIIREGFNVMGHDVPGVYDIGSKPGVQSLPLVGNKRAVRRRERQAAHHDDRVLAKYKHAFHAAMAHASKETPELEESFGLHLGGSDLSDQSHALNDQLSMVDNPMEMQAPNFSELDDAGKQSVRKAYTERLEAEKKRIDDFFDWDEQGVPSLKRIDDAKKTPLLKVEIRNTREQHRARLRKLRNAKNIPESVRNQSIRELEEENAKLLSRMQRFLDLAKTPEGIRELATERARADHRIKVHSSDNVDLYKTSLASRIEQLNSPITRAIQLALRARHARTRDGHDDHDMRLMAADQLSKLVESIDDPDIRARVENAIRPEAVDTTHAALRAYQDLEQKTNEIVQQAFGDNKKAARDYEALIDERAKGDDADLEEIARLEAELRKGVDPKMRGLADELIFGQHEYQPGMFTEGGEIPTAGDMAGINESSYDIMHEARMRVLERQRELGLKPTGSVYRTHRSRTVDGRPGAQEATKYFNVRMGMDALDTKSIVAAQDTAVGAMSARNRLMRLREHMVKWDHNRPMPRGHEWLVRPGGKQAEHLRSQLLEIVNRMNGDGSIIFDPDSTPYLQETIDWFEDVLATMDEGIIVPKDMRRDIIREANDTTRFLQTFFETPQRFWRALVLGYRPAWIVNQAIGNMFLLYATHGLYGMTREMLSLAGSRRTRDTYRQLKELIDTQAPDITSTNEINSLIEQYRVDPEDSISEATTKIERLRYETGKLYEKFMGARGPKGIPIGPEAWMRSISRTVDDPARRLSFMITMRPHVRALQDAIKRETGREVSYKEAAQRLLADDEFFDKTAQTVLDDMINFRDMSEAERKWVRPFIPFYSWVNGISRRSVRSLVETPGRAWLTYQQSRAGEEWLREKWGDVQDFVLEYFPLSDKKSEERMLALRTGGFNPLSTPSDLIGTLQALVGDKEWTGSENPFSMLNPVVKAMLETATGQDLYRNKKLQELQEPKQVNGHWVGGDPETGKLSLFSQRIMRQFPMVSAYEGGTSVSYPDDFREKGWKYSAASYLGVPIASINGRVAVSMGREAEQRRVQRELVQDRMRRFEYAAA